MLIGGTAASALLLAGCEDADRNRTAASNPQAREGIEFASLNDCLSVYSEATCKAAFATATPVFAAREACEAAAGAGNCQPVLREGAQAAAGESTWTPPTGGVLLAHMLNQAGQLAGARGAYVPRDQLPDGGRAAVRSGVAPRVLAAPPSDPRLAALAAPGGQQAATGATTQRGVFGAAGGRSFSAGGGSLGG
ncbi:MAG: hypothetical protein OHK0024_00820 [Thalassobaculales bacterium]